MGTDNKANIFISCDTKEKRTYRLTANQQLLIGNLGDNFSSETDLEIALLEANDQQYTFEVISSGPRILKFDNYLTEELIKIAGQLGSMYNRLELVFSREGELIRVNNREEIAAKWEKLKKELLEKDPLNAAGFVDVKEAELNNDGALEQAIYHSPPFHVFFNLLGRKLSLWSAYMESRTRYDQLNGSTPIRYDVNIAKESSDEGTSKYSITGYLADSLRQKEDIEQHMMAKMGIRADIDYTLIYYGEYIYDNNGWISQADLKIDDKVSPAHKSSIHYHLACEPSQE